MRPRWRDVRREAAVTLHHAGGRALPVFLAITVVASLLSAKGKAQHLASRVRHHALEYLDGNGDIGPAERAALYDNVMREEAALHAMPEKFREQYEHRELLELVDRVQSEHAVR